VINAKKTATKIEMTERIIIAGAGGQGIMLLGKVLSEAAMRENKYVTWLPSYGAEVRGGAAHCAVVISDKPIGSPYVEQADILIVMNAPSLEKFKERVKYKGLLIINSSLANTKIVAKGIRVISHPFTRMAVKLGNIKVANMLALGCLIGNTRAVKAKTILAVIAAMAPEDKKGLVKINQQALEEGLRLK